MVSWNSSPHPISDIRDWSEANRLELQPDFQRREVWSAPGTHHADGHHSAWYSHA